MAEKLTESSGIYTAYQQCVHKTRLCMNQSCTPNGIIMQCTIIYFYLGIWEMGCFEHNAMQHANSIHHKFLSIFMFKYTYLGFEV